MNETPDREMKAQKSVHAAGQTNSTPPLCRELRLALVCYGGVSLAIYMHGITVELQRLVAASAVFSRKPSGPNPFPTNSTEAVYWEALRRIAEANGGVVLRVVVDVIAGTSAGGINGIVLAKALARGLQQDPLRDVWFNKASLLKLLWPTPRPVRREGRDALPWAPLNGQRMSSWAYAALQEMNRKPLTGPAAGLALVPEGNELDLFVTTTDYTGFRRTIEMYDPETVHDLEYRHILHFHHDPQANGKDAFGPEDDRVLTLAVRSTSSFPGAFPPVTLGEVEAVAGKFNEEELKPHFTAYFLEGAKPTSSFFLDGGVLNNKPFDHAVRTIMERTADRQVDRRLLFIEPHPVDIVPDQTRRPTLLRTIIAALTTIPSHQPIADALAELARHNLRAVEIRQLIALTEPRVFELIQTVASDPANPLNIARASALPTLDLDTIECWADEVRKKAQQTADTSYPAYETIKIGEVLSDLSAGLCGLIGYPATSRHAALVHRIVRRWAMHEDLLINEAQIGDTETLNRFNSNADGRLWFLRTFDLNFRRRRLRFLIRCLNEAYPKAASDQAALRPRLDQVKQGLYGLIRMLRNVQSSRWIEDAGERELRDALVKLFGSQTLAPLMPDAAAAMPLAAGEEVVEGTSAGVSARAAQRLEARLDDYVMAHGDELKAVFTQLAAAIERQLSKYWAAQQDALSWLLGHSHLPHDLLQQMLERYIGYAYWDMVLYPLIAMSGVIEPDPVEVIRISPSDTKLLEPRGVEQRLKGVTAFHFGAFLNRSFRENDFLWGRLDGVERLLNMIGDVGARGDGADRQVSDTLVREGFRAVLAAEALTMRGKGSRNLVTRLRTQVGSG
jgi:patatin-related protein